MRRDRLFLIAIGAVGVLNLAIVGQDYLFHKLVNEPLRTQTANSPLVNSLRGLISRIDSGATRVTPERDTNAVKFAVRYASDAPNERANEAAVRLKVARAMLRNSVIVWFVQLALAAIACIQPRKSAIS